MLLRKEMLEAWRTYRLPVVAGLFVFVGLSSPLLARYLPEILKAAGGDQFGGLQLPVPTAADAVDQLWKNLAQFGAFAAIILAMGSVAGETDRGTAAFVLSKTASRGGVPGREGRWRSRPSWASARSSPWSVGWIYTAILFAPPSVAGWIALGVLAWLGLGAWAAITFLASTVTRSTAAAAGIGFMALARPLDRVGRAERGTGHARRAGGPGDRAGDRGAGRRSDDVLIPVVSTAVLIAIALGAAAWSFRRQEL